jgi:hypothetical protein
MTPITQCQQAVFEVAVELARQDKRLAELAATLPLPEDFDPDTLPSTAEMELYSRIQAVKADLQPGIAILFAGAQLNDADLRREWLRQPADALRADALRADALRADALRAAELRADDAELHAAAAAAAAAELRELRAAELRADDAELPDDDGELPDAELPETSMRSWPW